MKRIAYTLLILTLSVNAFSQGNPNRSPKPNFGDQRTRPEQPKVEVISRINKATGLSYFELDRKIEKKDKRIQRLDNFKDFEFVNLKYKNENSYFALKKKYTTGYMVKNNFREAWILSDAHALWLLDVDDYTQKVENMTDADTELRFDILLRRNMYDEYPQINDVDEKSDSELVIKFRLDQAKNKAYFLIYVIDHNDAITGLYAATGKDAYLQADNKFTKARYDQIASPTLDEKYCYETDYRTFISFLEGPLKQ